MTRRRSDSVAPKGRAVPDDVRTRPAPGDSHPLHHEPGRPARPDDLPRGRGKPIGQPDDFGRL